MATRRLPRWRQKARTTWKQRGGGPGRWLRHAVFERLEPRQVLAAPTLAPIPDLTVLAGAPLHVALDGFDSDSPQLSFRVEVANNTGQLSALIPEGNPSLRISVRDDADGIAGDMVFELFEDLVPNTVHRIVQLAEQGFYDGVIFHRVIKDFMIQGGDPTGTGSGGSGVRFDDEFHVLLQHTSAGVLSMAKSTDDTNDSQFFITSGPTRWLDFNHSVFGFLTEGDAIREAIENVPTGTGDRPIHDVVMTDVSVFFDTQNRVLRLVAPQGAAGEADVTVYVSDGQTEVSQTFHVIIEPDTGLYSNSNPFLQGVLQEGQSVPAIETTANTPVTVTLVGVDVEGDPIVFGATPNPPNANLAVSVSGANVTITPSGGIAGVYPILLSAQPYAGGPTDYQYVPLYIRPAAPSGIQLLPSADTGISSSDGITRLDNTPGKTLAFRVIGVVAGAEVELLADGQVIGQATASTGGTMVVLTDGTLALVDGAHAITARQTLRNQAVDVGNYHTTVDLASAISAPLEIVVDTLAPAITSVPPSNAAEGQLYVYDVQSDDEQAGRPVEYRLLASPAGMTIDAATGQIRWTPSDGQAPLQQVRVEVRDRAGNTTEQAFQIDVAAVNASPVAYSQTVTTPQDRTILIQLLGDDGDPEHQQVLRFALVAGPTHGTIHGFDEQTGQLLYEPPAGFSGTDSFSFTVTDDDTAGEPAKTSDPAVVTIHVTKVNTPPVAFDQTVTVEEDGSVVITLVGDDGDPEANQSLTFALGIRPQHGVLTDFNPLAGTVRYRPQANFNGLDGFTFTVTDDDTEGEPAKTSNPATVTLLVTAINDTPRITQGPLRLALNDPATWSFTLAAEDGDPEVTQQLTFAITVPPLHGQITAFDPASGAMTYTPQAGFLGSDRIVVTVTDDDQAGGPPKTSTAITVPITVFLLNRPPVGQPQDLTVAEDDVLTLTLSGDDGDPEVSQPLRFAIVRSPEHGQLTLDAQTGEVTYRPEPDFFGEDFFEFTVTDEDPAAEPTSASSAPARIAIRVTPVDDVPRFEAVTPPVAFTGLPWTTQVRAHDPDGQAEIRYSLEPPVPTGMEIDAQTGQLRWTPPEGFPAGTIPVAVRATEMVAGQPGLHSVLTLEVKVEDLRALALVALEEPLRPGFGAGPAPASPEGPLPQGPDLVAASGPLPAPVPGGFNPGAGLVAEFTDALFAREYGYEGRYGTYTGWGSNAAVSPAEPAPPSKTPRREPTPAPENNPTPTKNLPLQDHPADEGSRSTAAAVPAARESHEDRPALPPTPWPVAVEVLPAAADAALAEYSPEPPETAVTEPTE